MVRVYWLVCLCLPGSFFNHFCHPWTWGKYSFISLWEKICQILNLSPPAASSWNCLGCRDATTDSQSVLLRPFVCCESEHDSSFKPRWTLWTHSFTHMHIKLATWHNVTSILLSRSYKLQEGRVFWGDPLTCCCPGDGTSHAYPLRQGVPLPVKPWQNSCDLPDPIVTMSNNQLRSERIWDPDTCILPSSSRGIKPGHLLLSLSEDGVCVYQGNRS